MTLKLKLRGRRPKPVTCPHCGTQPAVFTNAREALELHERAYCEVYFVRYHRLAG